MLVRTIDVTSYWRRIRYGHFWKCLILTCPLSPVRFWVSMRGRGRPSWMQWCVMGCRPRMLSPTSGWSGTCEGSLRKSLSESWQFSAWSDKNKRYWCRISKKRKKNMYKKLHNDQILFIFEQISYIDFLGFHILVISATLKIIKSEHRCRCHDM